MSGDEKKISANQEIQKEIAIVDERTIRDKIYVVRGQKVMLDFELAEIYGYTTSAFNQQVKETRKSSPLISDFVSQKKSFKSCYHKMLQQVGAVTGVLNPGLFRKLVFICS